MGYGGLTYLYMPLVVINLAKFIEDDGYEAIPYGHQSDWRAIDNEGGSRPGYSRPVRPGQASPDVMVHQRIAAYLCGLGEIGYSKVLLTPEFGPRQRVGIVITDAELEPDPIIAPGTICDRCMLCARDCTGKAISTSESVKVVVAGRELEWGALDYEGCSRAFCGANHHHNPFAVTDEDREHFARRNEESEGYKVSPTYGYGRALEGARGCIRACMIHLEQQGKLGNTFDRPFRRRAEWRL